MKKTLFTLLTLATVSTLSFVASAADQAAVALPGHYYLRGVMEVGSELVLKQDGQFTWTLSYGNTDQQANGAWKAAGNELTLDTTGNDKEPQFRLFTKEEFGVDKPVKPGMWAAIVGVPELGPLPGIEVTFEAKSGKTMTAVTGDSGSATITMPASEQWVRAGLRRKGAKVDIHWLPVPPDRAQARVAAFAVTNPQPMGSQAFKKLALRVVKGGLKVSDESNGLSRGLYAK